jgi:hypothetical protein
MTYDWTTEAEKEGPQQADKLPTGEHPVAIARVIYGKRGGAPFESKNGDPQIMVIFAGVANGVNEDQEASRMYTLSKAAAGFMAQLLSRFGADTDQMKADGIEPKDLACYDVGDKYLVGLRGVIRVEWLDGLDYPEVEIVKVDRSNAAEVEPGTKPEQQPIDEGEIPF